MSLRFFLCRMIAAGVSRTIAARKLKNVVVATTNEEIIPWLQPDVVRAALHVAASVGFLLSVVRWLRPSFVCCSLQPPTFDLAALRGLPPLRPQLGRLATLLTFPPFPLQVVFLPSGRIALNPTRAARSSRSASTRRRTATGARSALCIRSASCRCAAAVSSSPSPPVGPCSNRWRPQRPAHCAKLRRSASSLRFQTSQSARR